MSRRNRIALRPGVLRWARKRAGIRRADLALKIKVKTERVVEWESTGNISVAQADKLAKCTHTPLGFLYLSEPPDDSLPIPDFRSRQPGGTPARPSPDLLETVYAMQRRHGWMREDLIESGAQPLEFVGAYSIQDSHVEVADAMREALRLPDGWAKHVSTWTAALAFLRDKLEASGVLVVGNGVVGNNTHRKLDPEEFQGFALVDEYAPLIFVNSADFVVARMFTVAHEMAHLCIGQSGVSRPESLRPPHEPPQNDTERFCDQVAAEFLVPEAALRDLWQSATRTGDPLQTIARHFKVSEIVAARRAFDLELIDRDAFVDFYRDQQQLKGSGQSAGKGGNFWNIQRWRIGSRFAGAVVRATMEERLPYLEAYSLTGLSGKSFDRLADEMDIHL